MIYEQDKANILMSMLTEEQMDDCDWIDLSTDVGILIAWSAMKRGQDIFAGIKHSAIVNLTLSEAKKTFSKLSPEDQHEFSHWAIREAHKDINQNNQSSEN